MFHAGAVLCVNEGYFQQTDLDQLCWTPVATGCGRAAQATCQVDLSLYYNTAAPITYQMSISMSPGCAMHAILLWVSIQRYGI